MSIDWKDYIPGDFYDELISTPGNARVSARGLTSYLASLTDICSNEWLIAGKTKFRCDTYEILNHVFRDSKSNRSHRSNFVQAPFGLRKHP